MPTVSGINPRSPLDLHVSIYPLVSIGGQRFLEDDFMNRCTFFRAARMQTTSTQGAVRRKKNSERLPIDMILTFANLLGLHMHGLHQFHNELLTGTIRYSVR